MDCSTSGLPVPHHLLKPAQVRVQCISDAIQPSHPLQSNIHMISIHSVDCDIYIYTHIYIILITRGDVFLSLNDSFICLLIWINIFLNFWKWWYLLFIFLKKSIPMLYSSLLSLSLNYYNSAEHLKVSCWLQNPLPHKISCVFLNKDILLHDCSKWLKSGNLILIQNNDIIFSPY